jgi:hypothetical protein
VADAETHLKGHAIRPSFRAARRTNIRVDNQFGTLQIDTTAPSRLLVPASKSLTVPVDAPDAAAHNVDHFQCYRASVTARTPRFQKRTVAVLDQFNTSERRLTVLGVSALCNPASVNGEAVKNPSDHLVCYRVAPERGQPRHARLTAIHTADRFGPEQIDTISEDTLCVPSTKTLPTVGALDAEMTEDDGNEAEE